MTNPYYKNYPNHLLYDVPQEILDVARKAMEGPVTWKDVDPDMAEPIADSIVADLKPYLKIPDNNFRLTLLEWIQNHMISTYDSDPYILSHTEALEELMEIINGTDSAVKENSKQQ